MSAKEARDGAFFKKNAYIEEPRVFSTSNKRVKCSKYFSKLLRKFSDPFHENLYCPVVNVINVPTFVIDQKLSLSVHFSARSGIRANCFRFLGGGIKIYSKKSFIALITGPRS